MHSNTRRPLFILITEQPCGVIVNLAPVYSAADLVTALSPDLNTATQDLQTRQHETSLRLGAFARPLG